MTQDILEGYEPGNVCPIYDCSKTIGQDHWVAEGDGFHTYHTDYQGTANVWETRDGLTVLPSTTNKP